MPYMSHSQVELLRQSGCTQLHWYRYNAEGKALAAEAGDLVGPHPVHLSFGIAVHSGVEAYINTKKETGEEPDLQDLWDAFEAKWVAEIEAHPDMDLSGPDGKEQSPAKLALDGKALLRLFHQQVGPQIVTPLGAEVKLVAPIPGHRGWDFIGYIDVLGLDHKGELRIWDIKTGLSAKDWTQEKADRHGQPPAYYWLLRQAGQPVPAAFTFVVLIRGLYGRAHKIVQVTTHREDYQVDAYGLQVDQAVRLRQSAIHAPNPNYQWHSRCPFLSICPHGDPKAAERAETEPVEEMDL